jgi:hypothetical protein
MQSIAMNCMPEVVSDLSYDFKKMLESCPPRALGWATDPRVYGNLREG